jgi:hypothetical protein
MDPAFFSAADPELTNLEASYRRVLVERFGRLTFRGIARTGKALSLRVFTAFAQRRKVTQPVIVSKPSTVKGLIWRRTAVAVSPTSPQRASANPIAAALYWRRGNTSRGTTRNTESQTTQR